MSSIGPQLPPHLLSALSKTLASDDEDNAPGPSGSTNSIGPQKPPSPAPAPTTTASAENAEDSDDDYAPTLPPGFTQTSKTSAARPIVGPPGPSSGRVVGATVPARPTYPADDDSDDDIGPRPAYAGPSIQKDAVTEFREREENRRKALEA